MSADTRPIPPARFAAALKDLSISMLHLKVLEIRNSIAHLQYSNDQLKPFAEGSAVALGDDSTNPQPDQECIDAIKENEGVIDRMAERIALIRAEVEDERGMSWTEFQSKEEAEEATDKTKEASENRVNGHEGGRQTGSELHSAWTDGTFQTGIIRNGEVHMDSQLAVPTNNTNTSGGSLSDEELRRAMDERMQNLDDDNEDEEGVHL
ncbi:hypothetical protein QQS21_001519 [Conoideocrella luteorostrata]|uniref:Secondary alcohol dehydrogenase n=1 Tax=Conoideocrella luteorostrata TaxID=1105319 RepID=A0AAJ0CWV2_9HYPO|nr:hypothetical protein QQS21_001519 [Conoideocrella luteorostrata]